MTAEDPRPAVRAVDGVLGVDGVACAACGDATVLPTHRCPVCGGPLRPRRFGPAGTVWSHTVVRVGFGGRTPPYPLAYVDLDGGARILGHLAPPSAAQVAVGDRVRLAGATPEGDPLLEVLA